jgi:hypothetical protein
VSTTNLTPARDPLGRSMHADLVETFAPLGASLRVETNSPDVASACRRSFGRFGPPAESARPPLRLRLLVDPSFDEAPPWPDPVFRGQGDVFYVSIGRQNTAVADLAAGFATGFISPALARDARLVRTAFVDCLVLTLLTQGRASARTYVHASAVARGGRGFLFSGPSGSGKSTLAFACARRGFEVVTDDVAYLEDGGDLTAWGKPWVLRLLPEARALFPELLTSPHAALHGDDLVEVDVDGILPGRTRTSCRPDAVFFLERCSGVSVVAPVERRRALELLSRDLIDDAPEALRRHEQVWSRLVDRGAYVLRLGENLDAAVDLVERSLVAHGD